MEETIGEMVRKAEYDYTKGTTQISKYVAFQMHDTLEKIDAYINSKHTTGEVDTLGREKPFFNIVAAAVNVWYRATDIDRKNIKIRATKSKDWIDSFLATILLRDWMRREHFGQFLNEWGRNLAKYGSSVVKFVRNSTGLHINVVKWNTIICDTVDFDNNIKIEVLELTEAQLYERVSTHGYNLDAVDSLCDAVTERETLDKRKKDNKSNYIKVYEVHGKLPLSLISGNEIDDDIFVQQMHVISFVGKRTGRNLEYQDFTLFKGQEKEDPYVITHLIKEDDRTLSIGAVESLFEAQWMTNHSMKAIKDTLDLSSKLIFQTADAAFVGRNVLDNIESGDILIHTVNNPLTKIENSKQDIVGWQTYAVAWKQAGNEATGISDAMLGAQPKSGTAWRQTEALLQESYSLFEIMTENKGLYLENMLREKVIPYLKTKIDTTEEISAILDDHEIQRIDSIYIKNESVRRANRQIVDHILSDDFLDSEPINPQQQAALINENAQGIKESLKSLSGQRFFKPSEIKGKTWKNQLKDLEWEVEVDITGEAYDAQEALTTLNTALKLVVTPGFAQNKKAQMIVGKILELTGTMSPIEYYSVPDDTAPVQGAGGSVPALPGVGL